MRNTAAAYVLKKGISHQFVAVEQRQAKALTPRSQSRSFVSKPSNFRDRLARGGMGVC